MARENSPRKVAEILIQVSDMQRSVKFYRDGLRISLKPTGYGDGSYSATLGGILFLVHPDFDLSIKDKPRGTGINIHFWVQDVDDYHAHLRRSRVKVIELPEDRPWGRHMALADPDGYRIEILGPVKKMKP